MYSVDKEDFIVTLYDKTNVLNDVDVILHEYDPFNEQLIIAYRNGNLDILTDHATLNFPDIRDNTNIFGSRTLNDIFVANENFVYFAADFGIVQFNLSKLEFGFSSFTEFPVNTVAATERFIYIGFDDGIYTFDLGLEGGNPNDFLQWQQISTLLCEKFVVFKGDPVFYSGDHLFRINADNSIEKIYTIPDPSYTTRFLNTDGNLLFLGAFRDQGYSSRVFITNLSDYNYTLPGCAFNVQDAIRDKNGKMWFADIHRNISWSPGIDQECNLIPLNSPRSFHCSDIHTFDKNIYVASGGAERDLYRYNSNSEGFYIFGNGIWKNYNSDNTEFIQNNGMSNFLNIQASKDHKKVFISSYGYGLLEMEVQDNSFRFYNHKNSKLAETQGDSPGRVRITNMKMDRGGNLWMTLFGVDKPLVVLTADGTWHSFSMPAGSTILGEMLIDQNDRIWVNVIGNGIAVFDHNKTIQDPTDDKVIQLTSQNTNMESNKIFSINADLNGNVWVGTQKGPIVFECSGDIMSGNCRGTRKRTVINGVVEYVLTDVPVNCMEFDGANRKWMGTSSGLYVLNPTGDEQLMYFNFENSPLFSNNITALAYNGETGEMLIGTEKGMLSYKTETTRGEKRNQHDAYAYPNPVPPDFNGLVAFKGLARDADIKITDLEGNLVFQTKAQGGQATWDGRDFRGNRVGSGVYTIFSTAPYDGFSSKDAISIKLFFIK
jgi:streptogramin lyase